MKHENIKFYHKCHKIIVSYAYGSDDGYYWDKQYFLMIDKTPYLFLVVGSGSGWIEIANALKKTTFDFLKNRKKENKSYGYNSVTIADFRQDKDIFIGLYDFMLKNNAEEVQEGDSIWDENYNDFFRDIKVIKQKE